MTTKRSQVHPLVAAKAYVALAGSIATALLGIYAADTQIGQVLVVIAVISTAVATWAVPNEDAAPEQGGRRAMKRDRRSQLGHGTYPSILYIAIVILVVVVILAIVGVL